MAEVSAVRRMRRPGSRSNWWAPTGHRQPRIATRRDLPPETLSWLYELMVVTRDLDGEFVNLQRQGELALFASCRGQEAAQIGAAACLRKTDWLFPQYREIGAFLIARHHAGADGRGLAGQVARRDRVHREVLSPRSPSRSAPTDCMRSARRWPLSGWARIR